MAEYIKRTDALRIVDEHHGARQAYQRIRKIPAADVAPVVHGRWKREEVPRWIVKGKVVSTSIVYMCSVCERCEDIKTTYCPNCGCRMDKDGE